MKIINSLRTGLMVLLTASSIQSIKGQFCNGLTTLTTATDTITDGSGSANYANNTTCSWLIQPGGSPANITLTMDSLNLSFFRDAVRVYDGTSNAGTLIANYRGNNLGFPAIANSGSMFVEFTTDGFYTAEGWRASYTSAMANCQPNTILTANNGAFTDGTRNGSNYANKINCEWLIQPATPSVFVELTFSRFSLAAGDSLILYDGVDATAPILATLLGNATTGTYLSSARNLFVRFVSTRNGPTSNGWRIIYNTRTIPTCAGLTTLTSQNGLFNDGSFPQLNYADNGNCQWLIQPPGALFVNLQFNYFSTEATYDFVNVYQGANNNGILLASFSGNNIPPSLTSMTGSMFIEFNTDGSVNSTGWEGSYTSSNLANITAAVDTIYLNAGAGSTNSFQLSANSSWTTTDNQSWLISTPVNGIGNQTINLLALQGNIGPERTAQLYINPINGSGGDTVTVIQRSSGRFLSIPIDTLFFLATGSPSQTFNLQSNVSWSLSNSQSWISLNPMNGNNNSNPQVSVADNPTNQIRSGFIVASGSQNAGNDTIYIIQDSLIQIFSVSPKNILLNYTTGSVDSVQVNANLSWVLTNSTSWITTSATSGSDSSSVTITANASNLTNTDRTAYVYFDAGNGKFVDSVLITQEFLPRNFSINPSSLTLASTLGSFDSIAVNANLPWTLINGASWLSTNMTSGNDSTTVIVSANSSSPTVNSRSTMIYFDAGNGQFSDSVEVTQQGLAAFLTGSPDTVFIGMASGEVATFNIAASGSWTVNSPNNWLVLNAIVGNVNGILTATTTSINSSTSRRIETLTISDTANNLIDTLVVVQAGTSGTIVISPSSITLPSSANGSGSFNVTSDINWSISGKPTWLNLSTSNGMNNAVINVSSNSINQTGSDRVATLLISGLGAVSKTINVTQVDANSTAFLLSVDTLFVESAAGSTANFTVIASNSWTLTESSPWLALNKSNGSNTDVITVLAVSENLFGTPRFTDVIATSPGNGNKLLVVAQFGAPLDFNYAPDSLIIGADSASFGTFNVGSNLISWNATTAANWLRVSPATGSLTGELTITATKPNTTGRQRSSFITISSAPFIPLQAKVTQDTVRSIGISERLFLNQVKIYPNPSIGEINIKFDKQIDTDNSSIEVRDLVGKLVSYEMRRVSGKHLVLNLSGLENGVYFIRLNMGSQSLTRKVLLIR